MTPMGGSPHRPAMRRALSALAVLCAGLSCAALLSAAFPAASWAQEEKGSSQRLSLSTGLTAGQNLDLTAGDNDSSLIRSQTHIGYDLHWASRTTNLSFGLGTSYEFDKNDSVLLPDFSLGLQHETSRLKFSIDASRSRSRVSDQTIDFDENGALVRYDGRGDKDLTRLKAQVVAGTDMPYGASLSYSYYGIDYSNAQSSSLYDSRTDQFQLGLRASLSPLTEATLSGTHELYDADNEAQSQRRTDTVSLGLTQRFDALTSGTLTLGQSRVATETTEGESTREGGVYGLALTRQDKLGNYGVSYRQAITANGARDSLQLRRVRDLFSGSLLVELGVTQGESNTTDWIGQVQLKQELRRDDITLRMQRGVITDGDGFDVVVTQARAQISHDLSELSALNFDLALTQRNYDSYSTLRSDASISWDRQLTRDATLSVGLSTSLSGDDRDDEDVTSHSVFVGLKRNFDGLF